MMLIQSKFRAKMIVKEAKTEALQTYWDKLLMELSKKASAQNDKQMKHVLKKIN